MMDKMKELWKLKKQMDDIKRELDNTFFDVASACGTVKISMNGSQEIKNISIESDLASIEKTSLEKILKDTYNKAIKRSHEIAAQKMKSVSGLNIPGLT
jgi:nucleoid-associated protein EbfC